jgi:hypothetical protein
MAILSHFRDINENEFGQQLNAAMHLHGKTDCRNERQKQEQKENRGSEVVTGIDTLGKYQDSVSGRNVHESHDGRAVHGYLKLGV